MINNWLDIMVIYMFCYVISLTNGIRGLVKLTHFFNRRVIDGITNERISRINNEVHKERGKNACKYLTIK